MHGIWVPPESIPTIHLVANIGESAAKIKQEISRCSRGRASVSVHRAPGSKRQLVADVEDAVEQVARFHDGETALVVMESALNLGLMSMSGIQAILEGPGK